MLARLSAALLLAIACAGNARQHNLAPSPRNGGATLLVSNRSLDDLVIALVRGQTRIRIGMVNALSTRRFEMTGAQFGAGGEARLSASSRNHSDLRVSAPFLAAAGHAIEWVIDFHNHDGSPVVVR